MNSDLCTLTQWLPVIRSFLHSTQLCLNNTRPEASLWTQLNESRMSKRETGLQMDRGDDKHHTDKLFPVTLLGFFYTERIWLSFSSLVLDNKGRDNSSTKKSTETRGWLTPQIQIHRILILKASSPWSTEQQKTGLVINIYGEFEENKVNFSLSGLHFFSYDMISFKIHIHSGDSRLLSDLWPLTLSNLFVCDILDRGSEAF